MHIDEMLTPTYILHILLTYYASRECKYMVCTALTLILVVMAKHVQMLNKLNIIEILNENADELDRKLLR